MGKGIKSKSPFGTLTSEQLANRSYNTLKLLSQYLGSKKFFFGDTMSILDMIGKVKCLTKIWPTVPDLVWLKIKI